jgi:hypothetical protein
MIAELGWVEDTMKSSNGPYTEEKVHLEDALNYAYTTLNSSNIKDGQKHVCIITCDDDPIGGKRSDKVC